MNKKKSKNKNNLLQDSNNLEVNYSFYKDELDFFENIERKTKFVKLSACPTIDLVESHTTNSTESRLLQFNIIYDCNHSPIAAIDFRAYFANKNLHAIQKDKKNLNHNGSVHLSQDTDKLVSTAITIDEAFEKRLNDKFLSFYSYDTIQDFLRDALCMLVDYVSSLDVSEYEDIRILDVNPSIEPIKNVKIVSPSFLIFLKNTKITQKLFYKIYNKICNVLSPAIIIESLEINHSDYEIFRVKEYYKLYEIVRDTNIFNVINFKKNKILNAKILLYTRKYIDGYLLVKNSSSLLKYMFLSFINYERCLEDLTKDIATYKHYLYLVYLRQIGNQKVKKQLSHEEICNMYKKGVEMFNNVPCKLAHLRYCKKQNLYESTYHEEIFYENYIIKRKQGECCYKYLSKLKKKLVKKKLTYDLLEQEMCYLENKPYSSTKKYYYLYQYKINRKIGKKDFNVTNGDSLILMYIYGYNINLIRTIYYIYNFRDGFYWSRTRNIMNFEERILETASIFSYDQDY